MTREQMVDQAVRRVYSLDLMRFVLVLTDDGTPLGPPEYDAYQIRAEFFRIADAQAAGEPL